ncbi:MAG: GyrI-like domain-containing protein [Bacteroidota bacterium]
MKKLDIKKELKEYYSPSSKEVSIVRIPSFRFLMIDGKGNPNSAPEYADAVETLFSTAYTIKFMIKKTKENIDYGVLPLEGLWWVPNMKDFSAERKEDWLWKMMIMQPDFVTDEIFRDAVGSVRRKKNLAAIDKLTFESFDEGLSAQILYHGPYSGEAPTIARLHDAIKNSGHSLSGKHHEIYLNDPRRTASEKLKTIIRQPMI